MNWENDFELPPAKKLRSDLLPSTDLVSPHDMMEDDEDNDDLYGTPPLETELTLDSRVQTTPIIDPSEQTNVVKVSFSLPGLGLVGNRLDDPSERLPTTHTTSEYHNDTISNFRLQSSSTFYANASEDCEISTPSSTQINKYYEGNEGTLGIENENVDHKVDRVSRDGMLQDKDLEVTHSANGQQSPFTAIALAHGIGEEPLALNKAKDQASIGTSTDKIFLPVVAVEAIKDIRNVQIHAFGERSMVSNGRFIATSQDEAGRVVCSPSALLDGPTRAQQTEYEANEAFGRMNGTTDAQRLLHAQDPKRPEERENCDAGNTPDASKDVSRDIVDQRDSARTDSVPSTVPKPKHILQYNCSSHDQPITSGAGLNIQVQRMSSAEAEVEVDSSPYESSSEDSTDSSQDESDNDYKMLEPAAQARLLMQEDGGSEDEGGTRGACKGPLRTLNEKLDEIVEIPDVTVTVDMRIEELGSVEVLVDNIVLVRAKTSGEYQVLEAGSVLCLADRTVIGVVAETLGRVQQPLYSVRFPSSSAITESGIIKESLIFYVPQHSTYVFTQTLKAVKGSDASNLHDEEIGDDELEFSDDEAEAEYKRKLKLQRQAKRAGRGASDGGPSYGSRQRDFRYKSRNESIRPGDINSPIISYDDTEDADELYTPLTRPAHLHEMMRQVQGSSQALQEDYRGAHHYGITRADYRRERGDRGRRGTGGRSRTHYRGRQRVDADTGHIQGSDSTNVFPSLNPDPASSYSVLTSDSSAPRAPPRPFPAHVYQSHSTAHNQNPAVGRSQGQLHYPYAPGRPPVSSELLVSYNQPIQRDCVPKLHFEHHRHSPQAHCIPQQPMSLYPNPVLPPGAFVNPAFFGNHYQEAHNQTLPNSQYLVSEQPPGLGPRAAPR